MEAQLKFITKQEAHEMIEKIPGDTIMVIHYNGSLGISGCGKQVKKKKSKRYINKSSVVVLVQNNPPTINLHDDYFDNFSKYNRFTNFLQILLPKLE